MALSTFGCDDAESPASEASEGQGDQGDAQLVCPSCETRGGGETADFGERPDGPGAGSSLCETEEMPVTSGVEARFELEELRAFLESGPHRVQGRVGGERDEDEGPPAEDGERLELELSFELGDFSYEQAVTQPEDLNLDCDAIRAPARVHVKVDEGLLELDAVGALYKAEGSLSAFVYASADLASATGSFEPPVDPSRLHAGMFEIALRVHPDRLRGDLNATIYYFDDEEQAADYLEGDSWVHADRETVLQVQFPDDACSDHERPVPMDEESDILHGRSPSNLRAEASARIAELETLPAVWRDDSETEVRIELQDATFELACLDADYAPSDSGDSGPELILTMQAAGRLSTADDAIDLPVERLVLFLDAADLALRRAALRTGTSATGTSATESGGTWRGFVHYDFAGETRADGIVELQNEAEGSYDCVAFPPGGKWDTDQCRYRR